jgi:hypothetical protein
MIVRSLASDLYKPKTTHMALMGSNPDKDMWLKFKVLRTPNQI